MKIFKYLFLKSFGVFSSLGILLMCFLVFMFSDAIIKGSVFCVCVQYRGLNSGYTLSHFTSPSFVMGFSIDSLANYLPGLGLILNTPDLFLLNSQDCRHEQLMPSEEFRFLKFLFAIDASTYKST
jgi:hypothetical protein